MTVSPAPPGHSPGSSAEGVRLSPRYGVPAAVLAIALATALITALARPQWTAVWAGALVLALFGLFLALQTALLRLEFNDDALLVWRQQTLLRRFPYQAWLGWRLFWPSLPVLFYFREQRSIHLLPVLFDAATLRQQLELRMPQLKPPAPSSDG